MGSGRNVSERGRGRTGVITGIRLSSVEEQKGRPNDHEDAHNANHHKENLQNFGHGSVHQKYSETANHRTGRPEGRMPLL